jgi:hypothetical protein
MRKLGLREVKSLTLALQLTSSGARRQARVSEYKSLGPLPPGLLSRGEGWPQSLSSLGRR